LSSTPKIALSEYHRQAAEAIQEEQEYTWHVAGQTSTTFFPLGVSAAVIRHWPKLVPTAKSTATHLQSPSDLQATHEDPAQGWQVTVADSYKVESTTPAALLSHLAP